MRELADFIKAGLSSSGEPSFGRISCAFILYSLTCWETYLVSKTGAWHDIPGNWLILILAIWTVAKGSEAVQSKIAATVEVSKNDKPVEP